MRHIRLVISFTAIFAMFLCSSLSAEVLCMRDLIDNDLYIDWGDKRFSDFEYSGTGDMPPASAVNVITFTDRDGNYGLTFQGGFVDLFGGGASDALIRYTVTVLDRNKWISDVHIFGNPIVIGNGTLNVAETFIPDESNQYITIYASSPGGAQRMDSVDFNGRYKVLHVQKNILAYAQTAGSAATLSFIDQSFSQYLVPEPTTMLTLVLGLVFMGYFVRSKRS
jgi:hypothetical protein